MTLVFQQIIELKGQKLLFSFQWMYIPYNELDGLCHEHENNQDYIIFYPKREQKQA
jgi:hypothetical protein